MNDGFARVGRWLAARAENIAAILLGSMFLAFIIQIIFRYVFNLPLGWTVEYSAIAWMWGILFGYAFVVPDRDIIRFDILYIVLPRRLQRVLDVVSSLGVAAIFAYSLPAVFDYVSFMTVEKTAFMRIPFSYVFSVYIAFALAVIVRNLLFAWRSLRGGGPRQEAYEEVRDA